MTALELKIPPPLLLVMAGATQWLLNRAVPALAIDIPAARWIALGAAVLGLAVATAGAVAFAAAKTTVDPLRPGKTATIVETGVYRISRNPMYLGLLLLLLGFALYLGHVLAFLVPPLFVVVLNRLQIGPEERVLNEKFGEPYRRYLASVRRWI